MKSKIFFWLLVVLVFGLLLGTGFLFLQTDIRKFFIIEGGTFLAILLFVLLYNRLIKPYQIILDGMELLKEQDFSSRLRAIGNTEANKLVEIFNKMMGQLKEERLKVRERNQFLDLLIQASPQGVVILDFDDRVSNINPAGIRLLNIKKQDDVFGKKLDESGINIGKSLAKLLPNDDVILRSSGITAYRCTRSSFIDQGFSHPFILIEELTHELLQAEKKSYEGIIRMMAHEVNNSTGAIGATLNVINDILKESENNNGLQDVLPAVETSLERCQHLSHFISNFAEVVKIPLPSVSSVDINELVRSVDNLMSAECYKRNITLKLDLTPDTNMVQIDGIQFEQVLINIVKNAYESIDTKGVICIKTGSFPLSICVEDNGPGIPDDIVDKLFTPFFTTKYTGQGIGLMFIREVLSNHKCKFNFYSTEGKTRFEIFFS